MYLSTGLTGAEPNLKKDGVLKYLTRIASQVLMLIKGLLTLMWIILSYANRRFSGRKL
jgi:hypothetical protein